MQHGIGQPRTAGDVATAMWRAVMGERPAPGSTIRVWDPAVRVFHWLLVAALAVAAITGFLLGMDTLAWHLVGGTTIAVLLLFRFVWGVLGGTYARFTRFLPVPATVLAHVRALRGGPHERHLGHNPLGALMVVALLGVLVLIVLTGTLTLGGVFKQGPLRAFTSYAVGWQAYNLHNFFGVVVLCMVGAHVLGVAYESWRGRENLLRAMLTGQKNLRPPAEVVRPAHAHPAAAAAIVLGVGLAGGAGVTALAGLPGLGVPPATLDPMYSDQCGACHIAYSPSLAPASTWNAILADLQHHFGDDATLSAAQIAHIRAYLDANSAGHWDTYPAHLMRTPAADGSLRLTDTPGWRRMHHNIPAAVFHSKAVYRRSACDACHSDAATGRFAPQNIAIPAKAGS